MTFRFCVFTAVSTPEQAASKHDSLDYQYRTAREYGERHGGTFVKLYRAGGYTRTDYYDLTRAFEEIPALSDLARDAAKNEFDVIIMESFDRLGDVAKMLFRYLKQLPNKIQLRSVQQPLPIENPANYDPSKDDSFSIVVGMADIFNAQRINKITRAFAVGNPKRAKDGKYSIQVPYGYIKVDKETVKIDNTVAQVLKKIPVWYTEGKSLKWMVDKLDTLIPPPRGKKWHYNTLVYILNNPFYAGKTFYDRGSKTKRGAPSPNTTLYDGKHEPLWSWEMFGKIQDEMTRRRKVRSTPRDYNFTSLLICSECGDALHFSSSSNGHYYWRCKNRHVSIRIDLANEQVAAELQRLMRDHDYNPPQKQDAQSEARRAIQSVERQIKRLDDAYNADAYTPEEYAEKRKALLTQKSDLQDEQKQAELSRRRDADKIRSVRTMKDLLPHFPRWVAEADPREVKFHLSRLFKMTAYPNKKIKVEFL